MPITLNRYIANIKPPEIPVAAKSRWPMWGTTDFTARQELAKTLGSISSNLLDKILEAESDRQKNQFQLNSENLITDFENFAMENENLPADFEGDIPEYFTNLYSQKHNETLGKIKEEFGKIKSERAKNISEGWMSDRLPQLKSAIDKYTYQRIKTAQIVDIKSRAIEAFQADKIELYSKILMNGVDKGLIDKDDALTSIATATKIKEKNDYDKLKDKVEKQVLGIEPEYAKILLLQKDKKGEFVNYRDLTNEDRRFVLELVNSFDVRQKSIATDKLKAEQEKTEQEFISLYIQKQLNTDVVEKSNLIADDKWKWISRVKTQTEELAKPKPIITDELVRTSLLTRSYDIGRGKAKRLDVQKEIIDNRKNLNDVDFEHLIGLTETQLNLMQSDSLRNALNYAESQIIKTTKAEDADLFAEQHNRLYEFDNEMRDWLNKNPEAGRNEIYIHGRELLPFYMPESLSYESYKKGFFKTPILSEIPLDVKGIMVTYGISQDEAEKMLKEKKQKIKSPFPEYPDAYIENGNWYVLRNGKRYRIQE